MPYLATDSTTPKEARPPPQILLRTAHCGKKLHTYYGGRAFRLCGILQTRNNGEVTSGSITDAAAYTGIDEVFVSPEALAEWEVKLSGFATGDHFSPPC
jgi:hypothetical protein